MHRLIREDETNTVYEDFAAKHSRHLIAIERARGEWSLVLSCPICGDWQTFEVDNEARREALKCKGSEATVEVRA